MGTERLWLTELRRSTALAKVIAVRGRAFAVDRSLFAPTSRTYRHSQPQDQGTVWVGGEKRRMMRSFERDGMLWHELRGTRPDVGETAQCQLDRERRDAASRGHTAMHLALAALAQAKAPPLVADPEVKGGGQFRFELQRAVTPDILAAVRKRVLQWAAQDFPVTREHWPRGSAAKVLTPQNFDPPDAFPGPEVLEAVRIDGVCAYPCDGTHLERTGKLKGLVFSHAQTRRDGRFILVGNSIG